VRHVTIWKEERDPELCLMDFAFPLLLFFFRSPFDLPPSSIRPYGECLSLFLCFPSDRWIRGESSLRNCFDVESRLPSFSYSLFVFLMNVGESSSTTSELQSDSKVALSTCERVKRILSSSPFT